MLDFLMAIVLFIAGMTAASGLYLTLSQGGDTADRADDLAAIRVQDRLVEDLLVTRPGQAALNGTCTDAFFTAETSTPAAQRCGFDHFNGSSESAYLHSALGLGPQYEVNISIGGPTSTTHEIGADRPTSGDVASYHRLVTFTEDRGPREFYTLRIWIWEGT